MGPRLPFTECVVCGDPLNEGRKMTCGHDCYLVFKGLREVNRHKKEEHPDRYYSMSAMRRILTKHKNDTTAPKTGGLRKGKYGQGQTTEAVEAQKAIDDFIANIEKGDK